LLTRKEERLVVVEAPGCSRYASLESSPEDVLCPLPGGVWESGAQMPHALGSLDYARLCCHPDSCGRLRRRMPA
jgi:hypothetical protein